MSIKGLSKNKVSNDTDQVGGKPTSNTLRNHFKSSMIGFLVLDKNHLKETQFSGAYDNFDDLHSSLQCQKFKPNLT